jgi:uncharacterized protein YyaL (SSP411 family)
MGASHGVLIILLLLSQTTLVREKKAEYVHAGRAVLSFIDKEFRDPEGDGFLTNPYGKPSKLVAEQAMVAEAHLELYNITRERKHLDRALAIMDHISLYDSRLGGVHRVAGLEGPFHIRDQASVMRAYMQAYRNTGNEEYRERYELLADFTIQNLSESVDGMRAWWDADNNTWGGVRSCRDYFEPATSLFQCYALSGNQTHLEAAKRILAASEEFWDDNNFGYSHGRDDFTRYSKDHVIAALAHLAAYDVTNRKDYLRRATDILFYMVSRMGDPVTQTFYEAISHDGEVLPPQRRLTADHLLLVNAYLYAYEVTLEDKYLNQGRSLLDSVLSKGYDKSVGSFTDQIGGGVMGDLQVQAYGAMALIEAYGILTLGPSPLLAIFVITVLVVLVGFVGYLIRKSWPY